MCLIDDFCDAFDVSLAFFSSTFRHVHICQVRRIL